MAPRISTEAASVHTRRAVGRIDYAIGTCSLGPILVATTDRGVCAILIDDDREALLDDLRRRFPQAALHEAMAVNAVFEKVLRFVEAPANGLEVPLDLRGTPFQQKVWQALCQVPAGTTTSYLRIAQRIGAPSASRAVGAAIAANPLAVVVPCHRVLRNDGALSGYRWGVDRKRALLEREAAARAAPAAAADATDDAAPVAAAHERV